MQHDLALNDPSESGLSAQQHGGFRAAWTFFATFAPTACDRKGTSRTMLSHLATAWTRAAIGSCVCGIRRSLLAFLLKSSVTNCLVCKKSACAENDMNLMSHRRGKGRPSRDVMCCGSCPRGQFGGDSGECNRAPTGHLSRPAASAPRDRAVTYAHAPAATSWRVCPQCRSRRG